ncbi:hypothetical protein ME7_01587 [Bartonella birtlesii LL-WM9]|uniref:Uncharacterized protein n=1 Tax=Bartonella birtlesii LL-WM9 TaxID=1094552 RepID=J0PVJ2_9HYPH|nr:hypothetical protein ME7_01587 [Bartonella birtlesii LL-WM9]
MGDTIILVSGDCNAILGHDLLEKKDGKAC